MSRQAFHSLEERMEAQLHAFGYAPVQEEERMSAPRMAVRAGAAGALGAGGVMAYRNREALATAGKDAARKGLKKTARGAGVASNALHQTALRSSGVAMRAAGMGSNVLQKASTGLRKVARNFRAGDVNAIVHLAERIAALEDEVEFEGAEKQRNPVGIQMVGQQMNGFLGGREAMLARDKFQQAGHVYRKRDAAKDGLKGGLGTSGVAIGSVAAGIGASRGVMKLAKSGKIPKGSMRKGAVKAAQVLKKAGRNPAVAIGGGLAALTGGALAGARIQRRAADKRLAKRQAQA